MNERVCPYLGFKNDPKTSTFSPDLRNACHQAKPPVHISITQQSSVCFSENFEECPGYCEGWDKNIPKELLAPDIYPTNSKKIWIYIVVCIAICLLGASGIYIGLNDGFPGFRNTEVATTTPSLYTVVQQPAKESTSTELPTETVIPLSTATSNESVNESENSEQPVDTQTPGPALLTPFVTENGEFVIHQVVQGESLQYIADMYQTDPDVLKVINAIESGSIFPEQILVVWIGQEVRENLPVLMAEFLEEGINVAVLAIETGTSVEDLREWNHLEDMDWIEGNRWVILKSPESE